MRPGLLTTVQDLGRWGFQSVGVPVAGAMDGVSHCIANLLVGNARSAATLEVTLTGPELIFSDERTVAVAGATFDLTVDGRPIVRSGSVGSGWSGGTLGSIVGSFTVPPGGVLRFGARLGGARAYLAIAGGIDVPIVLGSRATYLPARLGGLEGRPLAAGDQVPLGRRLPPQVASPTRPPPPSVSIPAGEWVVRILAGPQTDRFTGDALLTLQSGRYQILPASDRMGLRLSGPAVRHASGGQILSDATPPGTLQVPSSGQPILLMADRQTTGGYAKVATVISADLPVVAQAVAGEWLTFIECSQAEALAALIAQEQSVLAFEGA